MVPRCAGLRFPGPAPAAKNAVASAQGTWRLVGGMRTLRSSVQNMTEQSHLHRPQDDLKLQQLVTRSLCKAHAYHCLAGRGDLPQSSFAHNLPRLNGPQKKQSRKLAEHAVAAEIGACTVVFDAIEVKAVFL